MARAAYSLVLAVVAAAVLSGCALPFGSQPASYTYTDELPRGGWRAYEYELPRASRLAYVLDVGQGLMSVWVVETGQLTNFDTGERFEFYAAASAERVERAEADVNLPKGVFAVAVRCLAEDAPCRYALTVEIERL